MNLTELKQKGYSAGMSNAKRAKADRKKAKKYKNDLTKKVGFYDPITGCHSFADTEEKLFKQVEIIRQQKSNQYSFLIK